MTLLVIAQHIYWRCRDAGIDPLRLLLIGKNFGAGIAVMTMQKPCIVILPIFSKSSIVVEVITFSCHLCLTGTLGALSTVS